MYFKFFSPTKTVKIFEAYVINRLNQVFETKRRLIMQGKNSLHKHKTQQKTK